MTGNESGFRFKVASPVVQPTADPTTPGDTTPAPTTPAPAPDSSTWYSQNLVDTQISTIVQQDMTTDGQLTRSDMLSLFSTLDANGAVTSPEYQDLQTIVDNTSVIVMSAPMRNLSSKVVGSSQANALYQGQALGNLAVGSPASQLEDLVNKWFLGMDLPNSAPNQGGKPIAYGTPGGTLFGSGVKYSQIQRGDLGDCYLLSPLASIALHTPLAIQNLIVPNGDGTYTVEFQYDDKGVATADYVTVNSELPVSKGEFKYADGYRKFDSPNNVLWVPLVEKAYAQWSESGHNSLLHKSQDVNAYWTIGNGGYPDKILQQLTGNFAYTETRLAKLTFAQITSAFAAGTNVTFVSDSNEPPDHKIVNDHVYAMVNYNSSKQTKTITLFNPWGVKGGYDDSYFCPGKVTLSMKKLRSNFGWVAYLDTAS